MASVPATTFPRFLDLPYELRWDIYAYCLPVRVVDSRIIPEVIWPNLPSGLDHKKLEPALRYIVSKYTRMPVISRAIPEVFRKIRKHAVRPRLGQRAWNWIDYIGENKYSYQDPRPILFDPKFDILYFAPRDVDDDRSTLDRSPCRLAKSPDTIVALDAWTIETFAHTASTMDYCFLGRKHCIIILSETRLIKPMEYIVSCGLFGLFGEERTVLVDVDDLELIDYYDRKLNDQDIHPRKWDEGVIPPRLGGIRRYSSHGTVDPMRAWDEDSPVVSAQDRAQLVEQDKKEVLRRLKLAWLGENGCWDHPAEENPNFVPHERREDLPPRWDRVFDEEHPAAKLWLDKLPAFSFAVRLHAQDLEECRRIWMADISWSSYNKPQPARRAPGRGRRRRLRG
ncbi:hypothetical protein KVR01_011731 [Diaporthe batatas]|uniref:uncharacterized protein n=1 Tax=Diaporthe batatas TaxID=748121 RepID=UPI001D04557D|nr:uncharacterized protein KVR01_011731 [Diaporthe batatas]KAG8158609.1 hypothetical protein KVR01_011731 [Diaporthe batatas]